MQVVALAVLVNFDMLQYLHVNSMIYSREKNTTKGLATNNLPKIVPNANPAPRDGMEAK